MNSELRAQSYSDVQLRWAREGEKLAMQSAALPAQPERLSPTITVIYYLFS